MHEKAHFYLIFIKISIKELNKVAERTNVVKPSFMRIKLLSFWLSKLMLLGKRIIGITTPLDAI